MAWIVAAVLLAVAASGCGTMSRAELVESAPVDVEGTSLTRPGTVERHFDPMPQPEVSDATATSTTVAAPASSTTAAPAPTTTLYVPPPATTAPTQPPATNPPTTAPPREGPTVMASAMSADERIDRALAMVQLDWANMLPGWTLEFRGPRDGYQGVTFPKQHLIQVYIRSSSTPTLIAHVIAHEVGHAVDVTYLDDDDRSGFSIMRGRSANAVWWAGDGATDFASGAGDWAESFSWWATGGVGQWRSDLGSPPDAVQQLAISGLVTERSGIATPGVTVA